MNKMKWKMIEAEASRRTVLVLLVGCVGGGEGGLEMTKCTSKM